MRSHRHARSPETWTRRYTGTAGRGPGIPATHIDSIPNSCQKVEHWNRKQGAEAISIFHDPDTGEYYTHHVVPSSDNVYGPFTDEPTASNKLSELKST